MTKRSMYDPPLPLPVVRFLRPSQQASGENVNVYLCVGCSKVILSKNVGRNVARHRGECEGMIVRFSAEEA